jgi:UPF0716 family protein affecting phage T7 exclusion
MSALTIGLLSMVGIVLLHVVIGYLFVEKNGCATQNRELSSVDKTTNSTEKGNDEQAKTGRKFRQ